MCEIKSPREQIIMRYRLPVTRVPYIIRPRFILYCIINSKYSLLSTVTSDYLILFQSTFWRPSHSSLVLRNRHCFRRAFRDHKKMRNVSNYMCYVKKKNRQEHVLWRLSTESSITFLSSIKPHRLRIHIPKRERAIIDRW